MFAPVNYVGNNKSDDDNDTQQKLLLGSNFSNSEFDDEEEATKTARSSKKVVRAMKILSDTSYTSLPRRVIQAGTYRSTCSNSTYERNQSLCELGNLGTGFQGMSKEISQIGQKYKEPKTFKEAWNHPDPVQRKDVADCYNKRIHGYRQS